MKTRFSLLVALLFAGYSIAQVHIRIDDPETWSSDALIPYIGQTVIFDSPLVVSSNASYSTYIVGPRRLFTPTNQAYPRDTAAYNSVLRLNNSGAIELSDISGYHRCGEKIYNLKARVNSKNRLAWVSGSWKGNSRSDMEKANIRKMVNIDGCDECLLVCTMNLEYYLVASWGNDGMGPDTPEDHTTQRIKVSKALAKIAADLYGFVEIEQGQAAVAEIAADLNLYVNREITAPDKKKNYKYIDDGSSPKGSYTKAAFVYDSEKLRPIGKLQDISAGSIGKERHKMICFEEIATGERFIFSVNHFKAKSSCGSGADADQHDGQSCNNARRVAEAQAVVDMYRGYYNNKLIKDKDLLVMGDLNAYAKEDPITRFISNGMIDLHRAFHADSSYSYRMRGDRLAGYLDHALVNATLFPQIKGVAAFNINSDEDDEYRYDGSKSDQTMFRCSDHDPVIVGLKLDSTLMYDPSPSMNVAEIASGEDNELIIHNAIKDGQRAFYAIYSINGTLIERKEILENDQREALPLSPGVYIVYLYAEGRVYQRKLIIR